MTNNKTKQEIMKSFDKKCHIEFGKNGGFLIFPHATKKNKYKPIPFFSETAIKAFLSKSLDTSRRETLEEVKGLNIFTSKYRSKLFNRGINAVYRAIQDIDKPHEAKVTKLKNQK